MLTKDPTIDSCALAALLSDYGIAAARLEFLPVGADGHNYRVEGGGRWFVSIKRVMPQREAEVDAPGVEVRPKSPTGPLAPMRPACTRAFCAPRVRIANARAPVLGGPGAFGPPGHQLPRPGFRPHLWSGRTGPRAVCATRQASTSHRWRCPAPMAGT